jgi:hypothetical protein
MGEKTPLAKLMSETTAHPPQGSCRHGVRDRHRDLSRTDSKQRSATKQERTLKSECGVPFVVEQRGDQLNPMGALLSTRNSYSFFPSDLPSTALRRSSSNKLSGVSGEVLGTVLRRPFLVDGGEPGCEEGGA